MEDLELFQIFEEVSDWAWEQVAKWKPFDREVLGSQLVRSADSVGANLVEGDGRFGDADAVRFFVISRASAREARVWIRRAAKRRLIEQEDADAQVAKLSYATKQLNALINYRRASTKGTAVREERELYKADDSL